jgi:hypothetical protein
VSTQDEPFSEGGRQGGRTDRNGRSGASRSGGVSGGRGRPASGSDAGGRGPRRVAGQGRPGSGAGSTSGRRTPPSGGPRRAGSEAEGRGRPDTGGRGWSSRVAGARRQETGGAAPGGRRGTGSGGPSADGRASDRFGGPSGGARRTPAGKRLARFAVGEWSRLLVESFGRQSPRRRDAASWPGWIGTDRRPRSGRPRRPSRRAPREHRRPLVARRVSRWSSSDRRARPPGAGSWRASGGPGSRWPRDESRGGAGAQGRNRPEPRRDAGDRGSGSGARGGERQGSSGGRWPRDDSRGRPARTDGRDPPGTAPRCRCAHGRASGKLRRALATG